MVVLNAAFSAAHTVYALCSVFATPEKQPELAACCRITGNLADQRQPAAFMREIEVPDAQRPAYRPRQTHPGATGLQIECESERRFVLMLPGEHRVS